MNREGVLLHTIKHKQSEFMAHIRIKGAGLTNLSRNNLCRAAVFKYLREKDTVDIYTNCGHSHLDIQKGFAIFLTSALAL